MAVEIGVDILRRRDRVAHDHRVEILESSQLILAQFPLLGGCRVCIVFLDIVVGRS